MTREKPLIANSKPSFESKRRHFAANIYPFGFSISKKRKFRKRYKNNPT
jgi:hypothetical protein